MGCLCYYCYAKTISSAVQKRHSKVYAETLSPPPSIQYLLEVNPSLVWTPISGSKIFIISHHVIYKYKTFIYIYTWHYMLTIKPAKWLDRMGWHLMWTLMGGWGMFKALELKKIGNLNKKFNIFLKIFFSWTTPRPSADCRGQYNSKPNCCLGWKMKFWDNKLNTWNYWDIKWNYREKSKIIGTKNKTMW